MIYTGKNRDDPDRKDVINWDREASTPFVDLTVTDTCSKFCRALIYFCPDPGCG